MKKLFGIVMLVLMIFACASHFTQTAYALGVPGGVPVLEFGVEFEEDASTFQEFRDTAALSNATLYTFGEVDFGLAVLDWDLRSGWEDGKKVSSVDGVIGLYARIYRFKGGKLEVLAGVEQPVHLAGSGDILDDKRTYRARLRKPFTSLVGLIK